MENDRSISSVVDWPEAKEATVAVATAVADVSTDVAIDGSSDVSADNISSSNSNSNSNNNSIRNSSNKKSYPRMNRNRKIRGMRGLQQRLQSFQGKEEAEKQQPPQKKEEQKQQQQLLAHQAYLVANQQQQQQQQQQKQKQSQQQQQKKQQQHPRQGKENIGPTVGPNKLFTPSNFYLSVQAASIVESAASASASSAAAAAASVAAASATLTKYDDTVVGNMNGDRDLEQQQRIGNNYLYPNFDAVEDQEVMDYFRSCGATPSPSSSASPSPYSSPSRVMNRYKNNKVTTTNENIKPQPQPQEQKSSILEESTVVNQIAAALEGVEGATSAFPKKKPITTPPRHNNHGGVTSANAYHDPFPPLRDPLFDFDDCLVSHSHSHHSRGVPTTSMGDQDDDDEAESDDEDSEEAQIESLEKKHQISSMVNKYTSFLQQIREENEKGAEPADIKTEIEVAIMSTHSRVSDTGMDIDTERETERETETDTQIETETDTQIKTKTETKTEARETKVRKNDDVPPQKSCDGDEEEEKENNNSNDGASSSRPHCTRVIAAIPKSASSTSLDEYGTVVTAAAAVLLNGGGLPKPPPPLLQQQQLSSSTPSTPVLVRPLLVSQSLVPPSPRTYHRPHTNQTVVAGASLDEFESSCGESISDTSRQSTSSSWIRRRKARQEQQELECYGDPIARQARLTAKQLQRDNRKSNNNNNKKRRKSKYFNSKNSSSGIKSIGSGLYSTDQDSVQDTIDQSNIMGRAVSMAFDKMVGFASSSGGGRHEHRDRDRETDGYSSEESEDLMSGLHNALLSTFGCTSGGGGSSSVKSSSSRRKNKSKASSSSVSDTDAAETNNSIITTDDDTCTEVETIDGQSTQKGGELRTIGHARSRSDYSNTTTGTGSVGTGLSIASDGSLLSFVTTEELVDFSQETNNKSVTITTNNNNATTTVIDSAMDSKANHQAVVAAATAAPLLWSIADPPPIMKKSSLQSKNNGTPPVYTLQSEDVVVCPKSLEQDFPPVDLLNELPKDTETMFDDVNLYGKDFLKSASQSFDDMNVYGQDLLKNANTSIQGVLASSCSGEEGTNACAADASCTMDVVSSTDDTTFMNTLLEIARTTNNNNGSTMNKTLMNGVSAADTTTLETTTTKALDLDPMHTLIHTVSKSLDVITEIEETTPTTDAQAANKAASAAAALLTLDTISKSLEEISESEESAAAEMVAKRTSAAAAAAAVVVTRVEASPVQEADDRSAEELSEAPAAGRPESDRSLSLSSSSSTPNTEPNQFKINGESDVKELIELFDPAIKGSERMSSLETASIPTRESGAEEKQEVASSLDLDTAAAAVAVDDSVERSCYSPATQETEQASWFFRKAQEENEHQQHEEHHRGEDATVPPLIVLEDPSSHSQADINYQEEGDEPMDYDDIIAQEDPSFLPDYFENEKEKEWKDFTTTANLLETPRQRQRQAAADVAIDWSSTSIPFSRKSSNVNNDGTISSPSILWDTTATDIATNAATTTTMTSSAEERIAIKLTQKEKQTPSRNVPTTKDATARGVTSNAVVLETDVIKPRLEKSKSAPSTSSTRRRSKASSVLLSPTTTEKKKGKKSSSIDDDVSQTSTESSKKATKKFGRLKGMMARSFHKNRRNSKSNAKKITTPSLSSSSSKSQSSSGAKTKTPSSGSSKSARGRGGTSSESVVEEKSGSPDGVVKKLSKPRVVRRHISIDTLPSSNVTSKQNTLFDNTNSSTSDDGWVDFNGSPKTDSVSSSCPVTPVRIPSVVVETQKTSTIGADRIGLVRQHTGGGDDRELSYETSTIISSFGTPFCKDGLLNEGSTNGKFDVDDNDEAEAVTTSYDGFNNSFSNERSDHLEYRQASSPTDNNKQEHFLDFGHAPEEDTFSPTGNWESFEEDTCQLKTKTTTISPQKVSAFPTF